MRSGVGPGPDLDRTVRTRSSLGPGPGPPAGWTGPEGQGQVHSKYPRTRTGPDPGQSKLVPCLDTFLVSHFWVWVRYGAIDITGNTTECKNTTNSLTQLVSSSGSWIFMMLDPSQDSLTIIGDDAPIEPGVEAVAEPPEGSCMLGLAGPITS